MITGGEVLSGEVNSMLSHCGNLMTLVKAGHITIKGGKYLDMDVNRYFAEYFRSSYIWLICLILNVI